MQNGEILDCHDSLQLVALFAGLLLNLVMGDYSMCVVIWGMGFPWHGGWNSVSLLCSEVWVILVVIVQMETEWGGRTRSAIEALEPWGVRVHARETSTLWKRMMDRAAAPEDWVEAWACDGRSSHHKFWKPWHLVRMERGLRRRCWRFVSGRSSRCSICTFAFYAMHIILFEMVVGILRGLSKCIPVAHVVLQ